MRKQIRLGVLRCGLRSFCSSEFSEELSREHEIKSFVMRITSKLQFTLTVSFLYIYSKLLFEWRKWKNEIDSKLFLVFWRNPLQFTTGVIFFPPPPTHITDHLHFNLGPIWQSLPVYGSSAVGDHLRCCTALNYSDSRFASQNLRLNPPGRVILRALN